MTTIVTCWNCGAQHQPMPEPPPGPMSAAYPCVACGERTLVALRGREDDTGVLRWGLAVAGATLVLVTVGVVVFLSLIRWLIP